MFVGMVTRNWSELFYLGTQEVSENGVVQEDEVYVPGWGENKGVNDRFALLHPEVALQWRDRLPHALHHCRAEPIHSETFARRFADAQELTVRPLCQGILCKQNDSKRTMPTALCVNRTIHQFL